ncbi:unnamed protein product [Pedinophyceae sp. YPF-701]|nr:unnamed protein product [Pedinophyceae sp. YPF-701]
MLVPRACTVGRCASAPAERRHRAPGAPHRPGGCPGRVGQLGAAKCGCSRHQRAVVARSETDTDTQAGSAFLSDMLTFESDTQAHSMDDDAEERALQLVNRATSTLRRAEELLQKNEGDQGGRRGPAAPRGGAPPGSRTTKPQRSTASRKAPAPDAKNGAAKTSPSASRSGSDASRAGRVGAEGGKTAEGGARAPGAGAAENGYSGGSDAEFGHARFDPFAGPRPSAGADGPAPLRLKEEVGNQGVELAFKEPEAEARSLDLTFETEGEAKRAKATKEITLQLESVLDLTTAAAPPKQAAEEAASEEPVKEVLGRQLADGAGTLPDGTRWSKQSGVEYGANGLRKRWNLLRGETVDGVKFEECWWEATDWGGYKELGATKSGSSEDGAAWEQSWKEVLGRDGPRRIPFVERMAHKKARSAGGAEEWEEQWGEKYLARGPSQKYADKYGRTPTDIWHERWGEDYDGRGGCVKWTDRWSERDTGYGWRKWGEKWDERFANGTGSKNGETWNEEADGYRYNRWWGEDHMGGGQVRKHGHSTTGEYWDHVEHMDTYYNPIPHFDFGMALNHSPELRSLAVMPRDAKERELGGDAADGGDGTTGGGLADF